MRFLILIIGVFACSTAVIFLRTSSWPPMLLAAARLLAATLFLSPVYFIARKREAIATSTAIKNSFWPAVMLALHFMSWIVGVRMTTATNATLIVNLVPICMPFMLYLLIREKPNRYEYISTAIAMLGLAIIAIDDLNLSIDHFYGDLVCFASMLAFAFYLALARFYQHSKSIWLYVIPIYGISGIMCLCTSFAFEDWSAVSLDAEEWAYIAALGIIPTIIGHSILNLAMRWYRGQFVSVINLGQFIFAGLMAWPIFDEIPRYPFICAALCIVGAAVYLVKHQRTTTE